MQRSALII